MLKYIILSTPRCGSSTLMACSELYFGQGSFVREPLNPYENPELLPPILRSASIETRVATLCDPSCPILGMKHVYSPFNQLMVDQPDTLRRVLSIEGLRVIFLTRKNVRHQFISMEIALQTGDWWSSGPGALPAPLEHVKAGRNKPIDDVTVRDHLAALQQASAMLRECCQRLGVDFVELSYEDLFAAIPAIASGNILSALSHFGVAATDKVLNRRLSALVNEGRRFAEIERIQRRLGEIYPALRDSPSA